MTEFTVQKRENSGKGVARKLRAQGLIPGVCYGSGTEATAVIANPDVLYKMLTGEFRTNLVFKLNIEGGDTLSHVMVRDYQIDPVRRNLLHADFVAVDPTLPLRVTVPVKEQGKPVGVRQGGRFEKVRMNVDVICVPENIPAAIILDITDMDLDDAVMANELVYPDGVEPAFKMNYTVARVASPRGASEFDEVLEGEAGEEGETAEGSEDAPAES